MVKSERNELVRIFSERRGFTLVELIVVVAILAALAAVATPLYMRHRADALEAAGLENARLVAAAVNIHNGTTAPPVTQDALRAADTADKLQALLGGYTPAFSRDSDVASAVTRVSVGADGNAEIVTTP